MLQRARTVFLGNIPGFTCYYSLAAAATAIVVIAPTATAAVITAAGKDDNQKDHPGTAIITEKTIVTHKIFPPLFDYIP